LIVFEGVSLAYGQPCSRGKHSSRLRWRRNIEVRAFCPSSWWIGVHRIPRQTSPRYTPFFSCGIFSPSCAEYVTKKTNRHTTMRITSVWHEKRRWTYYSMLPSSLVHWVLGLVQPLKTKGIFLFQLLFVVFVHASDPLGTCISPRSIWL
jgi:hypothetical protein